MSQTEIPWRGYRIVQVDYKPISEFENYGFTVNQVFKVLDDFDDNALPMPEQVFWSPNDAIHALYMAESIAPEIVGKRKWPTTVTFEYHQMLAYRTHFYYVYEALQNIKKAIRDAKEWDENPGKRITDILNLLHQVVHERRERVR